MTKPFETCGQCEQLAVCRQSDVCAWHGPALAAVLDEAGADEQEIYIRRIPPYGPDPRDAEIARLRAALQNCVDYWPTALNDDLQERTYQEARAALEAALAARGT